MQYLFTLLFATLLVIAQSSWKVFVDRHKELFSDGIQITKLIPALFSFYFLVGLIIYVVATLLYMYMLSRYSFSMVQGLAIPLTLIFSMVVAVVFFGDRLTVINITGIALIALGIVLLVLNHR